MALAAPALSSTGVGVINPTGQVADVQLLTGTVQAAYATFPATSVPVIATPALPATGTLVVTTNPNPFAVAVLVTGGTTTAWQINGVAEGTTTPAYALVVPAGGTLAVTSSAQITGWTWTPAVCGATATANLAVGAGTGYGFQCPPGGSAVLYWTSTTPTWAWNNLVSPFSPPWPQGENTVLINQISQLPFPAHATLAETGLAVGVSN
ncbi:MAG: hypothetical protein ACRDOK_02645 [Streptosporangiaceae bacterium]